MGYLEARGNWFMKRTWTRKSRVRLPWNGKRTFANHIWSCILYVWDRRKVGQCIFRLLPGLVAQSCEHWIFCNSAFTLKLLRILRLVYTLLRVYSSLWAPPSLLQTLSCPPNNGDASATRGAIRQFTPSHQCHAFSWCSVSLISIPSLVFFFNVSFSFLYSVFNCNFQLPDFVSTIRQITGSVSEQIPRFRKKKSYPRKLNRFFSFATGVNDTGGQPWAANISANFRKNSKRSYLDTLGLGGNWLMKKTGSKKSRDTVPLRAGYSVKCIRNRNLGKPLMIFEKPLRWCFPRDFSSFTISLSVRNSMNFFLFTSIHYLQTYSWIDCI